MTSGAPEKQPALEMASVLFMDIVSFSRFPLEKQPDLLSRLEAIVRDTPQFQAARDAGELISLPTGDGMALVFFNRDPIPPVRCAIEVQKKLLGDQELRLRTGLHNGPVLRHHDI